MNPSTGSPGPASGHESDPRPGDQHFLKIAMLIVVIGCLVAVTFIEFLAPGQTRRLTGFALTAVAALFTLVELQRNRLPSAYRALTYGAWFGITVSAALNGGMTSPALLAYPVLILIAGWVMSARTALILGALSLAAEAFFVVGTARQWLPAQAAPSQAWIAFVHTLIIVVSASLAAFIRRSFAVKLEEATGLNAVLARQMAEIASRDEELRSRHVFQTALLNAQASAGIGMYIVEADRISYANQAVCDLFGYSEAELMALPSFLELIQPDERERIRDKYRRCGAGEPLAEPYDVSIVTRAGGRKEVEATVRLLQDGTAARVLTIVTDVTERRRAEIQARLSEERFAKVFQVSPVAASIARAADGSFLEVNDIYRQNFGWTRDEMIGRTSVALGLWPDDAARRPWIENLRRAGRVLDHETVWRDKSGRPRNVRLSAAIIEFRGEDCVLALVHDITALRQSELRFSQVFGISPVPISISHVADGRYLEVNDAFLALFGLERRQVIGRTSVELGIWAESGHRQAWMDKFRLQDSVPAYETELRDSKGRRRIVNLSGTKVELAGENCMLAFVYDITERRRAEAMLREIVEGTSRVTGAAFFRALVRHLARVLDVPFALVGEVRPGQPDKLHTLAFWSRSGFAANTDYDLGTTPCGNVFGGSPQLFAAGLRELFPEAGCSLEALGAESYYGHPLESAAGEPLGVLAILDDKPMQASEERASLMAVFAARAAAELERLRAEADVLASERKFSRIFHTSPVAISITRLDDGLFHEVNDAYVRHLGWQRSELIGHSSGELGLWQDIAKRRAWVDTLKQRSRVFAHEAQMRDRHGNERVTLISAERLDFAGEECVLSFLYDITERKRAEAEIRQLNAELEDRVRRRTAELTDVNRELEAFAYSISHDLRAPLRGIDGFSRLLQEEYGERLDDQGNEYLIRVRRAAQRLGTLIDDMLELSRVSRREMHRDRVNLSALVADIADDLRKTEPGRSVEFVVAADCSADGDPLLLRVLLENLLGNAWKYSRDTPQARIEFGFDGAADAYFVRDNGAGFDMAYADKLFKPFQRLHNPSEFEGSGIGLASAARAVRRHGGQIWAESSPGQGAVFRFTLGNPDA